MAFEIKINRASTDPLTLTVSNGEMLFVLGANGTGKSSLMLQIYQTHRDHARRVSAHRQTWMESGAVEISAQERVKNAEHIDLYDRQAESRWKDDWARARAGVVVFDLTDAENVRARGIAAAVDGKDFERAEQLSSVESPVTVINRLLRLSNLDVQIAIRANQEIFARKSGGPEYSIAQLSDGERNAILIAANVLTAETGGLIIIDEPERHLHRSIISPLLSLLLAQRRDCAFVVSTHEVMLPLDNPSAQTLLTRGCTYANGKVTAYDVDLVPSDAVIGDELRATILGERRKLVFVEGTGKSLDKPLYSLLLPGASVVPKASFREVEHAVIAIRDTKDLHWVHAFGIVDNDSRPAGEIAELRSKGIYALKVHSVESVYYHPEMQRRVAVRHCSVTGDDVDARLADARKAALNSIAAQQQRLSERVAEKTVREQVFKALPKKGEVGSKSVLFVTVDMATIVADERRRIEQMLQAGDLEGVISRYPVRETAALAEMAKRLGFQGRNQYESAVRRTLLDDEDALAFARALLESLHADIAA